MRILTFVIVWGIAIALYYIRKKLEYKRTERFEYEESKKIVDDKPTYKCDAQIKYINHRLNSLYEKRKEWELYDSLGIKDTKGNVCKKEDCVEYLKIENDIEILENKKRKLEYKCN